MSFQEDQIKYLCSEIIVEDTSVDTSLDLQLNVLLRLDLTLESLWTGSKWSVSLVGFWIPYRY